MAETRKLAAIMAVDVVGYSRLMGDDEAGTARAVKEHRDAERPIVAGLGGRIVKTMGDGLLLEFPSVVAAVECAVVIQKLMAECNVEKPEDKRIVYRIADEYESGYICRPASSTSTLSLRELIALMESACEGSSIIFPILNMNLRNSAVLELEEFVSVTSDFYPDLGRYYRALTDAWLEERAREKSDES